MLLIPYSSPVLASLLLAFDLSGFRLWLQATSIGIDSPSILAVPAPAVVADSGSLAVTLASYDIVWLMWKPYVKLWSWILSIPAVEFTPKDDQVHF